MSTVLSSKLRGIIYGIMFLGGLAVGAIPVGYEAAHVAVPGWYGVGTAVFGFLVTAPSLLARINLTPDEAANLAAAQAPKRAAIQSASAPVAPVSPAPDSAVVESDDDVVEAAPAP